MASLDPPVRIMGGYAEDALLAGTVTRPHGDVDWLIHRSEYELRLAQARELGFGELEVWGESAPGRPFYLYGENGDLKLEAGVADEEGGALWIQISSLRFELDGNPPPAGFRFRLPPDTFSHPPVELDGVTVWPISPLALYQLRAGIAQWGAFGDLDEKQLRSMAELQRRFFPGRSDDELVPEVEPL